MSEQHHRETIIKATADGPREEREVDLIYVLVSGAPGSGKSTLVADFTTCLSPTDRLRVRFFETQRPIRRQLVDFEATPSISYHHVHAPLTEHQKMTLKVLARERCFSVDRSKSCIGGLRGLLNPGTLAKLQAEGLTDSKVRSSSPGGSRLTHYWLTKRGAEVERDLD